MSDWIHNLPVPLMALAIFAFTYLLAIIIFAGVSALATGERAKSFQAISPGMLPVLGIIFGLFVAFTAAQVWSDNDRASAAVSREASALRAVMLLAAGLQPEQEGRLLDLIRGYVEQTAKVEWPMMARQKASLRAAPAALAEALQLQWDAAKADLQQRLDAVTSARDAAAAAETARAAAAEAARQVERELQPISVLISRKTQRLYVRQAFKPILESPVTIADPDRPIGTHVFTAIERSTDDAKVRWSAVSLDGGRPPSATVEPHDRARASSGRDVEPVPTDPDGAKAALDRIAIPQDALDRIGNITPRSSLIVTDEALSPETGKGTEFVVLLSGEPQGGIKNRRRRPATEFRYARPRSLPFWRSPFGSPFSTW